MGIIFYFHLICFFLHPREPKELGHSAWQIATSGLKFSLVWCMCLYCWAIICDSGPTIQQHWANVSCLLGWYISVTFFLMQTTACTGCEPSHWYWRCAGLSMLIGQYYPAKTTHLPNDWPMLAHRRRRWASIGQSLGILFCRVCWVGGAYCWWSRLIWWHSLRFPGQ